ncbi:MAG TPA: protein kinase [Thermoanaerobaculia bacterium]|nr:protein kinase [Thermoanaerobaculia bacterium]
MRPRLSLGLRIFLITALLVVLAVGAAVAVTYLFGRQIAEQTARQALDRSASVQQALQLARLEQLELIARVFAADPALTAYVAEARAQEQYLSILDQLEERQNELGFDFAIALDPEGRVLARTDDPDALGEDLAERPLVAQALDEYQAFGVWRQDGRLFHAVVVPLVSGDRLLEGFLLAGFAVDDLTALEVRRISDAEVAFLTTFDGQLRVVASTLDPALGQQLLRTLAAGGVLSEVMGGEESAERVELRLGDRRWMGLVRPLTDASGETVGAAVSLASPDVQLRPFERLGTILLLVGLAAVLVASLLSYLLSRRVMRPVRQLAAAAAAAREGHYDQRIAVDRSDEVGQLAAAFDVLLSELREKQDMEAYMAELSRTLPSGREEGVEAPRQLAVALLGLDLRRYGNPKLAIDPEHTLDLLGRDLRRLQTAVESRGGRLHSLQGQRLVAVFEGENRAFQALSAATEAFASLAGAPDLGRDDPPSAALVEGQVLGGSVVVGEGPAPVLVGRPLQQLESLLREATPGDIVLAPAFYEGLEGAFGRQGVELVPQRGLLGTRKVYVLDGGMAARVTGVVPAVAELPTPQLVERPTLSEIAPGTVLGDRFEILSVLGAGGMGVVYKVRDRQLDDLVALKMLKQEVWGNRDQLERLKSELKLARKITHPNVLRTFDFGEVDGIPFITMEYVRGITLRYLLQKTGALPYSAGLRLARQLCRGLAAAHAVGVLHRDIKPENLLVEPSGNAKLMDFGIARPIARGLAEGQTQPGTVVGTPQYLAPEQLQGEPVDQRADLYAVGVVLYELFTDRTPFAGRNPMQVIVATLNEAPPPPRQHWPEIPPALEAILLRCLEKDPERRYATAEALLADLEELRA